MIRTLFFATALAVSALGHSAVAGAESRRDDVVSLELSAEDWVETATAGVVVAADLAVEAGRLGEARAALLRDLAKISDKAEWRLTGHDRLADEAGYERWRIAAEARLPGEALGGLGAAIKGLSRPGHGFALVSVDYTPTLAEREAVLAKLRARIHEAVAAELKRVNAIYADRGFRVAAVRFAEPGTAPLPRKLQAEAAMPMAVSAVRPVSQKVVLTAEVELAASLPKAK